MPKGNFGDNFSFLAPWEPKKSQKAHNQRRVEQALLISVNLVRFIETALKHLWNHRRFWQTLPIWNHCASEKSSAVAEQCRTRGVYLEPKEFKGSKVSESIFISLQDKKTRNSTFTMELSSISGTCGHRAWVFSVHSQTILKSNKNFDDRIPAIVCHLDYS